jgi:hypothetical protein
MDTITNVYERNENHRGKILEHIIRKSPYSIKVLSKKLGISRTTLYARFKSSQLDYEFLLEVSRILHFDLKDKIPQKYTQVILPVGQFNEQNIIIDKKYIQLLEGYQRLFEFLTKITHKYGLENTRNQLDKTYQNRP